MHFILLRLIDLLSHTNMPQLVCACEKISSNHKLVTCQRVLLIPLTLAYNHIVIRMKIQFKIILTKTPFQNLMNEIPVYLKQI